jgi:ferric-dicitrate binding protein FerR (iron transport regulator)
MNESGYEEIDQLIVHCLEGVATPEEKELLEIWIKTKSSNSAYFNQLKNIWEASGRKFNPSFISTENALEKVLARTARKNIFWQYWQKAAAILIIPLLIGGYWWGRNKSGGFNQSAVTFNEVFAAYGTRSALQLADGTRVWLNSGSSLRYPVT